jgi:hypothetical protein
MKSLTFRCTEDMGNLCAVRGAGRCEASSPLFLRFTPLGKMVRTAQHNSEETVRTDLSDAPQSPSSGSSPIGL